MTSANLRFGVRSDDWEAAVYINNIGDEAAKLGLDQERGRVARVGFLTNQPRTIGVTFRKNFGGEARAAAGAGRRPPPPPPPPPRRRRRRRPRRRLRVTGTRTA